MQLWPVGACIISSLLFPDRLSGDAAYVKKYFSDYSSSVVRPLICTVGFILITHLVVMRGVRDGIEKASNLFMPILFVLLVIIAIASCSLPGAIEGIRFLFSLISVR